MPRSSEPMLASCPGAEVPHEVEWKPISPIGATELAEKVNAVNCHGGRGWHPDHQLVWMDAERAAAAAASPQPPVPPPAPDMDPTGL
jgi:hypothetical protein